MTKTSLLPDCLNTPELLPDAIQAALDNNIITATQKTILTDTMGTINTIAEQATLGDRTPEVVLHEIDSAFRRLQFGNYPASPEQKYAATQLLENITTILGSFIGITHTRIKALFPSSNPLMHWSHHATS